MNLPTSLSQINFKEMDNIWPFNFHSPVKQAGSERVNGLTLLSHRKAGEEKIRD
jgi:hypothetical protein